jgi:capsular exopolysaccharide synthesis family protein
MTPSSNPPSEQPATTAGQLTAPPGRVPDNRVSQTVPPAVSAAPTFLALLRCFKRCWLPATVVGLLCGVLAGGLAWVLSPGPKYTARALVELPDPNPNILIHMHDNRAGFEAYQRMQLALVKSPHVLKQVLDDAAVKQLPTYKKTIAEELNHYQWLEREVHADFNPGTNLLRISMNGENGEELLTLVNTLTRKYVEETVDKASGRRNARLEKLRGFEKRYDERLKEKQRDLKRLAEMAKVGAGDKDLLVNKLPVLQIPLESELRQLQELQKTMRELRWKAAYYQAKEWSIWPAHTAPLAVLPQSGLPVNLAVNGLMVAQAAARVEPPPGTAPVAEGAITFTINEQESVKKLQAEVDKHANRVNYLTHITPKGKKTPGVSKADLDALKEARAKLNAERARLRKEIIADLRQRGIAEARQKRQLIQEELEMLQPMAEMIHKSVEALQREDQKMDVDALGAATLRREVETIEGVLKTIRANIDELELQKEIHPGMPPLEEAILYREVGKARQIALTSLAGTGSLALVMLGFSWWEFRRRRVNSPDEVVTSLGMRLVGALPDLALRHRRNLLHRQDVPEEHWQNLLAASVDSVRTTLLHAEQHYGVRVVVISSAVAGEGKTSLSCHLAASLDRAGRRTLLIDADLRAPTAHRLFDARRAPGFSEVLRGEVSLAEAIQQTPVGNLAFLAAGRPDHEAIHTLAQPRLADLLRQIRGQYDCVLIDTCPVLPVADSLLLGQHADAVIFSVLRDISRMPKVYAAYQRVSTLGIPILGAVVSGARDELYAAGYHYVYAAANEDEPADAAEVKQP